MNSKFLPIQFNDSQQSSDKILIQNGCFIKPKQESEFGSQNNIENQEEEKHELKTNTKYVWESTQLLRYIIFLEKYTDEILQMRKYDYAICIFTKMARFIESKHSQICREFHKQQLKRVPVLARLIQNIKESFYTTKEEVLYETKRIDQFFQKDLEGQLNSFKTKKSFLIESSKEQLSDIAKNVQQWIIKDQQEKEKKGQKGFFYEDDEWRKKEIVSLEKCQKKQSYLIQIPIQLCICFKKQENTKKLSTQLEQKGQNISLQLDGYPKISLSNKNKSNLNTKKNEKQKIEDSVLDDNIYDGKYPLDDFQDEIIETKKGKDCLQNVGEIIEEKSGDAGQLTQEKNTALKMWTISENMKFFAFLATNYQAFIIENTSLKQNIFKKMRDFIGTNKTQENCSSHFKDMKKRSTFVLRKLIKELGKHYKITLKFIEELKDFIYNHTKIVDIKIAKDELLTLSIQPTIAQIPQKEKIEIFMERILEEGMEISFQINRSIFFQNTEEQIAGRKYSSDSLSENGNLLRYPKTLKRKIILSLPEDSIEKLEKKENSNEFKTIKFYHIIKVKLSEI